MSHKRFIGIGLLAGCVLLSLSTLGWSDEDERWEHEEGFSFWQQSSDIPPVTNKTYETECSVCHFAYPAGLLPERSWVRIMQNLDQHFGDNAELDTQTSDEILRYLRGHAADRIPNRFSRSLLRSLATNETSLRISKTAFFQHKHREIPARMVANNPEVRSFSNCVACHSMAKKGIFNEHGVHIPGFGSWED